MVSSYKDITAENIKGRLDIRTTSGSITANSIGKNVDIISKYKPIQISHVGGSLKIDGQSCSVMAEDIQGDVNISNSYKYVILKQTMGSIVVKGSSSPIEITGIKKMPKDGGIELITTYKPITLHLPESADVILSAYTTYGKINSDFPVYLSSAKNAAPEAAEKKGSTLVRLETSGNITVKKIKD